MSNFNNKNIKVYKFALYPESHEPSGTCNLSRIDEVSLKLQTINICSNKQCNNHYHYDSYYILYNNIMQKQNKSCLNTVNLLILIIISKKNKNHWLPTELFNLINEDLINLKKRY